MNAIDRRSAHLPSGDDLASLSIEAHACDAEGDVRDIVWQIPEEVAVAVQINSVPFTVMMATPADLADFGLGITLAEGVVPSAADVRGVLVMPVNGGFAVDIAIDEAKLDASRMASRTVEGRSGCGLCGIEDISGVVRVSKPVARHGAPSLEAILKAAQALPSLQPMNRHNRTVHGAAWVMADGEIAIVREDVGRHNALDKLIGAMAKAGTDYRQGFVLMTSRCSFELVQKCALAGIGALVTVSAPTTLALELAEKSNVFLATLGEGGAVIFNP